MLVNFTLVALLVAQKPDGRYGRPWWYRAVAPVCGVIRARITNQMEPGSLEPGNFVPRAPYSVYQGLRIQYINTVDQEV
jgi:hypothetical protein